MTFYNSDGTAFGTTLANSGSNDVFLVKYNSSGFVQWCTRLASTGNDVPNPSISLDSSNNVYIVGYYSATFTLYNSDGTAFGTTLPITTAFDGFLVKYNSSGFVQWGAKIGGTGNNDTVQAVTTDSSDNVYIGGQYNSNPLTIYNSNGTAFGTTLALSTGLDAFVAKYNSAGSVQWCTRMIGSGANDYVNSIVTDSSGNIYASGLYDSNPLTIYNSDGTAFGTTLANSGSTDCFIVKYNSSGFVQWCSRIAGTGGENPYTITIDSYGNIYIPGPYSSNPLTFYNSDGTAFGTTLSLSVANDSFIVKYNSSGFVQWCTKIGGNGNDICSTVSLDSLGNLYSCGYYGSNPLTFYNSDGTAFGTTLALVTNPDIFIVKYS